MADALANLTAKVEKLESVEEGAITTFKAISKQLADLIAQNGDSVKASDVQAVADRIDADADKWAAAITAGTAKGAARLQ